MDSFQPERGLDTSSCSHHLLDLFGLRVKLNYAPFPLLTKHSFFCASHRAYHTFSSEPTQLWAEVYNPQLCGKFTFLPENQFGFYHGGTGSSCTNGFLILHGFWYYPNFIWFTTLWLNAWVFLVRRSVALDCNWILTKVGVKNLLINMTSISR